MAESIKSEAWEDSLPPPPPPAYARTSPGTSSLLSRVVGLSEFIRREYAMRRLSSVGFGGRFLRTMALGVGLLLQRVSASVVSASCWESVSCRLCFSFSASESC
eukprot:7367552-Pyramimonas_sp.AAC.1